MVMKWLTLCWDPYFHPPQTGPVYLWVSEHEHTDPDWDLSSEDRTYWEGLWCAAELSPPSSPGNCWFSEMRRFFEPKAFSISGWSVPQKQCIWKMHEFWMTDTNDCDLGNHAMYCIWKVTERTGAIYSSINRITTYLRRSHGILIWSILPCLPSSSLTKNLAGALK